MVSTNRVTEIFADTRAVHADALERLAQGDIRDTAEKAWCATKRATDALILARTGEEPERSPVTSRELGRLAERDRGCTACCPAITPGWGNCTASAFTWVCAIPWPPPSGESGRRLTTSATPRPWPNNELGLSIQEWRNQPDSSLGNISRPSLVTVEAPALCHILLVPGWIEGDNQFTLDRFAGLLMALYRVEPQIESRTVHGSPVDQVVDSAICLLAAFVAVPR